MLYCTANFPQPTAATSIICRFYCTDYLAFRYLSEDKLLLYYVDIIHHNCPRHYFFPQFNTPTPPSKSERIYNYYGWMERTKYRPREWGEGTQLSYYWHSQSLTTDLNCPRYTPKAQFSTHTRPRCLELFIHIQARHNINSTKPRFLGTTLDV